MCYNAGSMNDDPLGSLTFEQAKALEGTSFWVYPEDDHKVQLLVLEVGKVMESEAARLTRNAFSIFMLGPASYELKQGAFAMTHDAFPEPFYMFVTTVGKDE